MVLTADKAVPAFTAAGYSLPPRSCRTAAFPPQAKPVYPQSGSAVTGICRFMHLGALQTLTTRIPFAAFGGYFHDFRRCFYRAGPKKATPRNGKLIFSKIFSEV